MVFRLHSAGTVTSVLRCYKRVSLCTLSLLAELWYLVVDDICDSSRRKSENGGDLHLGGQLRFVCIAGAREGIYKAIDRSLEKQQRTQVFFVGKAAKRTSGLKGGSHWPAQTYCRTSLHPRPLAHVFTIIIRAFALLDGMALRVYALDGLHFPLPSCHTPNGESTGASTLANNAGALEALHIRSTATCSPNPEIVRAPKMMAVYGTRRRAPCAPLCQNVVCLPCGLWASSQWKIGTVTIQRDS
jgi:hypothetical protein